MDRIIYVFNGSGEWVKIGEPKGCVENKNYLITCIYGDWSGFRTLAGCLKQQMAEDGKTYTIVER